jgi:sugar (pentulose or hexulose) kinase
MGALVAAIDCGTTAVKAAVFDLRGHSRILESIKRCGLFQDLAQKDYNDVL